MARTTIGMAATTTIDRRTDANIEAKAGIELDNATQHHSWRVWSDLSVCTAARERRPNLRTALSVCRSAQAT